MRPNMNGHARTRSPARTRSLSCRLACTHVKQLCMYSYSVRCSLTLSLPPPRRRRCQAVCLFVNDTASAPVRRRMLPEPSGTVRGCRVGAARRTI